MKYSTTPTEELRDLLIDKLIKNPNDIVIEDSIDYITNTIKEITRLQQENKQLKDRIDKATKDLQELIDKVNNKTIIGLNEFILKLEIIQDELAGDKE